MTRAILLRDDEGQFYTPPEPELDRLRRELQAARLKLAQKAICERCGHVQGRQFASSNSSTTTVRWMWAGWDTDA